MKHSSLAALVQQSFMANPMVETSKNDYNAYFDLNNRHEIKIGKDLRLVQSASSVSSFEFPKGDLRFVRTLDFFS